MSTGHVLLGLLSRGQQHGYDLKAGYDALFPAARPMAYGQVYAALTRLRDRGLIEEAAVERAGGPERTTYRLTPAGRDELEVWMSAAEHPPSEVNNPLATKLNVALVAGGPEEGALFLRRQRSAHTARMRDHTQTKRAADATLTQVLAADYALSHLDADVRWIDDALARLGEITQEVTP